MSRDQILSEYYNARDAALSNAGVLDDTVLAPLVNPGFMGSPVWPDFRQAYKFVDLGDHGTIIATDGLCDPFSDTHPHFNPEVSGYELELFLHTDENIDATSNHSWQTAIISAMAAQVADHGGIAALLSEHGLVSIQLPAVALPDEFVDEGSQSVCILLGLESAHMPQEIDLPLGTAKYVSTTLLTNNEADQAASGNRSELGEKLLAQNGTALSTLHRCSVF